MPSAEAEADVYRASAYVAKLTMKVLEELFTEARSVFEYNSSHLRHIICKIDSHYSTTAYHLDLPVRADILLICTTLVLNIMTVCTSVLNINGLYILRSIGKEWYGLL